jgi:hypothetical protein
MTTQSRRYALSDPHDTQRTHRRFLTGETLGTASLARMAQHDRRRPEISGYHPGKRRWYGLSWSSDDTITQGKGVAI